MLTLPSYPSHPSLPSLDAHPSLLLCYRVTFARSSTFSAKALSRPAFLPARPAPAANLRLDFDHRATPQSIQATSKPQVDRYIASPSPPPSRTRERETRTDSYRPDRDDTRSRRHARERSRSRSPPPRRSHHSSSRRDYSPEPYHRSAKSSDREPRRSTRDRDDDRNDRYADEYSSRKRKA